MIARRVYLFAHGAGEPFCLVCYLVDLIGSLAWILGAFIRKSGTFLVLGTLCHSLATCGETMATQRRCITMRYAPKGAWH